MSTIEEEDPDPGENILENFNDELKFEIFRYLSSLDLLNLTETSKRLKTTVEKSPQLMAKLEVSISRLISSNCTSTRSYSKVTFDALLPESSFELIKTSFPNIRSSVKELKFTGNIFQNYVISDSFAELFDNINTLILTSKEDIPQLSPSSDLSKYFPHLRTLKVYNDLYSENIPFMKQVVKVFMLDGIMFTFDRPFESIPNVQELIIYKAALPMIFYDTNWEVNLNHLAKLSMLTLKDCGIGVHLEFKSLKALTLINCTFYNNEESSFLPEECEIENLYLENCEECFWLSKFLTSKSKVKHMTLLKMTLTDNNEELLEDFINGCESYTIDIIFLNKFGLKKSLLRKS